MTSDKLISQINEADKAVFLATEAGNNKPLIFQDGKGRGAVLLGTDQMNPQFEALFGRPFALAKTDISGARKAARDYTLDTLFLFALPSERPRAIPA
jgi:hypothetical protein